MPLVSVSARRPSPLHHCPPAAAGGALRQALGRDIPKCSVEAGGGADSGDRSQAVPEGPASPVSPCPPALQTKVCVCVTGRESGKRKGPEGLPDSKCT